MPGELFYCIHCLRSDKVVRTFYEQLPELISHIGTEHHPNQPLHGRDWLWGEGELDAFWQMERTHQREVADTFHRLAAVETVDDFLKLL